MGPGFVAHGLSFPEYRKLIELVYLFLFDPSISEIINNDNLEEKSVLKKKKKKNHPRFV